MTSRPEGEYPTPIPDPTPPRKPSWQSLAVVGFVAGVVTVLLVLFVL